LGISIAALFLSGAAPAESAKAPRVQKEEPSVLRTDVKPQAAKSKGGTGEIPGVDSQLTNARDQAEIAASRIRELDQQTRRLERDLEGQREAASDAQASFEKRVRAAYKREDLAGVSIVLDSLLSGDSARLNTVLAGSMARILFRENGSTKYYKERLPAGVREHRSATASEDGSPKNCLKSRDNGPRNCVGGKRS
jgi:hypothetical protein